MTLAKITRKDEALIAALLSNPTVRAAAKAVGRSETQVYARLRDPDFKSRYDSARHELLEQSTAALQGQTLFSLLNPLEYASPNQKHSTV